MPTIEVDCARCGGTGEKEPGRDYKKNSCPECRGSGTVKAESFTCSVCGDQRPTDEQYECEYCKEDICEECYYSGSCCEEASADAQSGTGPMFTPPEETEDERKERETKELLEREKSNDEMLKDLFGDE